MTGKTTPPYGPERIDPADVSYEPYGYEVKDGNEVVRPPYYYLVSRPDARVVWVQPTSETGLDARGWFAPFVGPPGEYEAVVPE